MSPAPSSPSGRDHRRASAPDSVPAPPDAAADTVLTDHTSTLATLIDLPMDEHAAILTAIHDDLAHTLRQAEH